MNKWIFVGCGLMIFGIILTIVALYYIIRNNKSGIYKDEVPVAKPETFPDDVRHTKDETIHTERLEIVPLRYEYLYMLIYDLPVLEEVLNFKYKATPITGPFKSILESQLKVLEHEKDNYLWCSFWLIIRKSDRTVVGSIDFKDSPNKKGEVEIGYGLGKSFEDNGYMTEAVKAFCNWAFDHAHVDHILAETEIANIASQNVLIKCGFKETSRKKTVWWST